jgi:hypothetical protein
MGYPAAELLLVEAREITRARHGFPLSARRQLGDSSKAKLTASDKNFCIYKRSWS